MKHVMNVTHLEENSLKSKASGIKWEHNFFFFYEDTIFQSPKLNQNVICFAYNLIWRHFSSSSIWNYIYIYIYTIYTQIRWIPIQVLIICKYSIMRQPLLHIILNFVCLLLTVIYMVNDLLHSIIKYKQWFFILWFLIIFLQYLYVNFLIDFN